MGLDIQPNGIRLLGLKKIKHTFYLGDIGMRDKGIDAFFMHGTIKYWDQLTVVLTDMVENMGIKGRSVSLHLPLHLVNMQRLQLPLDVSDAQIALEIHAHMKEQGLIEEMFFHDYYRFIKNECSEILYVAASREYLSRYIECVDQAGLRVKAIDIDVYALLRVIQYVYDQFSQHDRSVCLHQQVALHPFTREQQAGNILLYFTHLNVTLVLLNGFEMIAYRCWEVTDEKYWFQLNNDILSFLTSFPSTHFQKLIICGAHPCVSVIVDALTQHYGLPVYFPDIFAHFKPFNRNCYDQYHAADFLLACGLAMRENDKW